MKHFPKRALVIGGGTVLASRWSHRVSRDCDMFADEQVFREVDFDALRREVDARLQSGELIRARLSRRTLFIESRDGELSLVGDSPEQPRHPTARIGGISTHPVGEILRRKVEYRLLSRGLVEARNFRSRYPDSTIPSGLASLSTSRWPDMTYRVPVRTSSPAGFDRSTPSQPWKAASSTRCLANSIATAVCPGSGSWNERSVFPFGTSPERCVRAMFVRHIRACGSTSTLGRPASRKGHGNDGHHGR